MNQLADRIARQWGRVMLIVWIAGLCLCQGQDLRAEKVYLDIVASDVRKVMIAVPPFRDKDSGNVGEKGMDLARLLARGLEFHGFIQILDPGRYGSNTDADWKSFGVDYVVLGVVSRSGGKMILEGKLLDVADNRMLAGRRYRGLPEQAEDMVLRFCDALIGEFTGEPGISRTSIAFISDATGAKEVYVADVLGRRVRQVTRHRHLCVSPRFSPDGNLLAYSTYHHGNQDLYITDLRQNKITRAISRRRGLNLAPAFSPDGKTMVVTLSKDGGPDLYLMNLQGKILKRLTARAGINVSPSFSPDGSMLAFVSDRSGQPQIYIMQMGDGRIQRLTFHGMENSEPSWSPKGDQLAYTGLQDGHYQIFTIHVPDGQDYRQVTSGWGDFESPSWSPDGKQIVFTRRRNGRQELCRVFRNGKDLQVLFRLKGNQSSPQWSSRPR